MDRKSIGSQSEVEGEHLDSVCNDAPYTKSHDRKKQAFDLKHSVNPPQEA
jgi:hypothetical protein